MDSIQFEVNEQMDSFVELGGTILACGTCVKIRHLEASEICPLSTMQDLYRLIRDLDKVLSF